MPAQTTTLTLPANNPFAVDAMLRFLNTHTVPGVEYVSGRSYHRALRLPHGTGTVTLTLPEADGLPQVTARTRVDHAADLPAAVAFCRQLLDLDADAALVDASLSADPALTAVIRLNPGLRVPGAADGPEMLIRAMLGQQVSVAGAQTAASRLVAAADHRLPEPDGELTHLFPTPDAIAALGPEIFVGPRRRAQAIHAAAVAMADGSLQVSAERPAADLIADLVARPGIGPWTAGYVVMRLGNDRDVLLTGDLVLRRGAALVGLPDAPRALALRSAPWQPYRSYAGMHLWAVALAQRATAGRSPGR